MDMDVSNKLNNYQSGAQTVSKAPTAVRNASVKRIASSLNELKKGQVFEGNISSVRGSQVSIKLITGETLKANIDPRSGVQLREGENMFFLERFEPDRDPTVYGQRRADEPDTVQGASERGTLDKR